MSQFAVIRISLLEPDAYIEGVECVKVYSSEGEAQAYIEGIQDDRKRISMARTKYIEEYVERFVVPTDLNYQAWSKYIEDLFGYHHSHIDQTNFKKNLRSILMQGYGIKFEKLVGYIQMPKGNTRGYTDLHVVEIKEAN